MFYVAILVWMVGTGAVWEMGRGGIRDCCVSHCICGCVVGVGPLWCRGVLCGGLGEDTRVWKAAETS